MARRRAGKKARAGKARGASASGGTKPRSKEPLAQVEALLEAGRPEEAGRALAGVTGERNHVRRLRERIDDLALRKLQRQRRTDRFAAAAQGRPALGLAAARLAGPEALAIHAAGDDDDAVHARVACAPDLRTALRELRSAGGESGSSAAHREFAQAWMLLLRGEYARAQAALGELQGSHPRRARAGLAVALALQGEIEEARGLWRAVGPFPHSVLPAASAFGRWLEKAAAGSACDVATLFAQGDDLAVGAALAACESGDGRARAWLSLAAGDHAMAAGDTHEAERFYRQAQGLHGEVRVDGLKRLVQVELATDAMPESLVRLYEVLVADDPERAVEAVEAIGAQIPDHLLVEWCDRRLLPADAMPDPAIPAPWLRLWLRKALVITDLRRSWYVPVLNVPVLLPKKLTTLDRILAALDAAYGETDVGYLRLLLRLYAHYGNRTRQRTTCYRLLVSDPTLAGELVNTYVSCAAADARGRKRMVAECEHLERVLPHALPIYLLHMRYAPTADVDALGARLRSAQGKAAERFVRWHRRPVPDTFPLEVLGSDFQVDVCAVRGLASYACKDEAVADRILGSLATTPMRLRNVVEQVAGSMSPGAHAELLARWARVAPDAWQPRFLALHRVLMAGDDAVAAAAVLEVVEDAFAAPWEALSKKLVRLMDADDPERPAVDAMVERLRAIDHMTDGEFDAPDDWGFDRFTSDDEEEDEEGEDGVAGVLAEIEKDALVVVPAFWTGLQQDERLTLAVLLSGMVVMCAGEVSASMI
ncbi:MAG: hypothetical protein ACOCZK_02750 [Planctomycetota bacterium]